MSSLWLLPTPRHGEVLVPLPALVSERMAFFSSRFRCPHQGRPPQRRLRQLPSQSAVRWLRTCPSQHHLQHHRLRKRPCLQISLRPRLRTPLLRRRQRRQRRSVQVAAPAASRADLSRWLTWNDCGERSRRRRKRWRRHELRRSASNRSSTHLAARRTCSSRSSSTPKTR